MVFMRRAVTSHLMTRTGTSSYKTSRRRVIELGVAGAVSLLLPAGPQISASAQTTSDWTDLIALTPDPTVWAEEVPAELFTTADIALQLETLGLSIPESMDDPDFAAWIAATYSLGFPGAISGLLMLPESSSYLGWNITQVDQTLESVWLPEGLMLVRGRFDSAAVQSTWSELGYEEVSIDGFDVAQISAEVGFDFSTDFGRASMGKLNNAVFLDEQTLAYTTSQKVMEAVIATANGSAGSIQDNDQVAELIAAVPEPLVTSSLISGEALSGVPEVTDRGIKDGGIPPIALALLGHTPGLPLLGPKAEEIEVGADAPESVILMALVYFEGADVEAALATVLDSLASDTAPSSEQPYTDFFTSWKGKVVPDSSIVLLELTPSENPAIWRQLLYRRDLGFLT